MTELDRLEALEKEFLEAATLEAQVRISLAYQLAVLEAAPALIAVARAAEDEDLFELCECREVHFVNPCPGCSAFERLLAALRALNAEAPGDAE